MGELERRAREVLEERKDEYLELDAWDSKLDAKWLIRCPGCGKPMLLGDGWTGCSIPECPECNDTADEWSYDPVVTESQAKELAADERNFSELIQS
jgi:hypothetical protein